MQSMCSQGPNISSGGKQDSDQNVPMHSLISIFSVCRVQIGIFLKSCFASIATGNHVIQYHL